MSEVDPYNATLIERRDLNDQLAIVRVQPDSLRVPEFIPGQFVDLGLPVDPAQSPVPAAQGPPRSRPRLVRRSFSIASPPQVTDHVELFVVLVQGGRFTPRLWTVEQGGRLWLSEKAAGMFTMQNVEPGKDLVMIATGTGLGPFMSMLRAYRHDRPRRWRRFVILHSARLASDLGYHAELQRICDEDSSVIYIPTVTREPADSPWTGLRGRVQNIFEHDHYQRITGSPLDPAQSHVFLCGNPQMIDAMQPLLVDRGFQPDTREVTGTIHYERYW